MPLFRDRPYCFYTLRFTRLDSLRGRPLTLWRLPDFRSRLPHVHHHIRLLQPVCNSHEVMLEECKKVVNTLYRNCDLVRSSWIPNLARLKEPANLTFRALSRGR
jgi:hypothetical protein